MGALPRPWRDPPAMPSGLDPVAGSTLFGLPKAARLDALRRLAVAGLKAGELGDHEAAAAAELILAALASNRPGDLLVDLSILTRGGASPAAAQLADRDAMLAAVRRAVPE